MIPYIQRMINYDNFRKCDWAEFYQDGKEPILINAPELRDTEGYTCTFLGSNHVVDKRCCRSRSGFVI